MKFIDTHTHLFSNQFDDDSVETIQRALENGVEKMFLPNISVETIPAMMKLSETYADNCFPMLGLHPCDVTADFESDLKKIEPLFEQHKFYGVGETGLDLYWDKSTLDLQVASLKVHIDWAKQYKLPIIIHARESYDELFEVFDKENDPDLTGIFHCFTGSKAQAEKIIGYGNFKLGIGGVLTFKNSGLAETLADVDLEHLVLETDSPYLAPTPHRGKRNESAHLIYVASKLAEVKNVDIETISVQTTKNAAEIFKLN